MEYKIFVLDIDGDVAIFKTKSMGWTDAGWLKILDAVCSLQDGWTSETMSLIFPPHRVLEIDMIN